MKIQEMHLEQLFKKNNTACTFPSPHTPQTRVRPNSPEPYIPDWVLGEAFTID